MGNDTSRSSPPSSNNHSNNQQSENENDNAQHQHHTQQQYPVAHCTPLELLYFAVMAKGLGPALILQHSGLPWKGNSDLNFKAKDDWRVSEAENTAR